jgi:hypothetical protein
MWSGVRSGMAASAAIVGASVIAVNPLVPPSAVHSTDRAVRLAADSLANVPANLIITIASIPANEIVALNEFADSMYFSWWTYTRQHVEGFDPADAVRLSAIADILVPIPAVSKPLGDQLNVFAEAELPMNPGCPTLPKCDLVALFSGFLKVPVSDLISGYTFPRVLNAFDGSDTIPWSKQTVQLDLLAPVRASLASLTAPPTGITAVPPETVLNTVPKLVESLYASFNPFVPGSLIYGGPGTVPDEISSELATPSSPAASVPRDTTAIIASGQATPGAGLGRHRHGIPVKNLIEAATTARGATATAISTHNKTVTSIQTMSRTAPSDGKPADGVKSVSHRISSGGRRGVHTARVMHEPEDTQSDY